MKTSNGITYSESSNTVFVKNLTANSNVTATSFIGDGSLLTGVSSAAAFNQANYAIGAVTTANGNITSPFNQANSGLYVANTINTSITAITSNIANLVGALNTANGNINAAFTKANTGGGGSGGSSTGSNIYLAYNFGGL
jgi:hypothetical protein